ncbi:hypothetical protein [Niveibacterium sp. SC-1]|uniref:hypothetical protein n=1 Tax=Niveibacterium sp. SC-1 TaxID=3135646 RepID=UPI00311E96D2
MLHQYARLFAGLLLLLALPVTRAADPIQTDGDKYKIVLENDRVRVLEYRDQPGQRTHEHQHPAFVVIALEPFKRAIHLADGRTLVREFKAGDVLYSKGETHTGENVGSVPTHGILVELKDAREPGSP